MSNRNRELFNIGMDIKICLAAPTTNKNNSSLQNFRINKPMYELCCK